MENCKRGCQGDLWDSEEPSGYVKGSPEYVICVIFSILLSGQMNMRESLETREPPGACKASGSSKNIEDCEEPVSPQKNLPDSELTY